MENSKIFYLDPLFDLQLCGYPIEKVKNSAAEMSILFLPCCSSRDSLIIDIDVQESYLSYLKSCGITLPETISRSVVQNIPAKKVGIPWGWSSQSIDKLNENGAVCDSPALDIVKKINNRQFCNEIGIKYNLGVPGSQFCTTMNDVQKAAQSLHGKFPLVIKPAFGGSGFGLRIINALSEVSSQSVHIEYCLSHGGVVVEPWCQRLYELSTNLYLGKNGKLTYMRHQRLFSNEYGSFFGIYVAPHDPYLEKWKDNLENSALSAVEEIKKTGYYGPVGFDSFVYKTSDGSEHLASIIEINGRHVMSHIAYAVRDQIAIGKHCFLRMINKKRCKLPSSYESLESHCGKNLLNVLIVTPLRIRHLDQWIQPSKNVFFIYADTEKELFNTDKQLRDLLTK